MFARVYLGRIIHYEHTDLRACSAMSVGSRVDTDTPKVQVCSFERTMQKRRNVPPTP